MNAPNVQRRGDRLHAEIQHRLQSGGERVSVAELGARVAALGYELDRSLDCRSMAVYLTGPRAGETYPAITTGIREADTKRSFAHFESRRDANFEALQELRGMLFAVTRGAILEL